MKHDDFDYIDDIDEQELLYEIGRLQKKLDRMEADSRGTEDRDLADEIDRLNDELRAMRRGKNYDSDDQSKFRYRSESHDDIDGQLSFIIEKISDAPSAEELQKAIQALRKSAVMLERSSGEKIATELAALKTAITSCPTLVLPAPKKDETFALKQFFEIKRLLGGYDEKYAKYINSAMIQIDELCKAKEAVSSPSLPFIEKLFAILNLYNLLNDNEPIKEVVDSYNLMVNDFFNQNLSAEKMDNLVYFSEVSAMYKVSDVIKAKTKKFYSLYDEVLTAKAGKQIDLIRQIFDIKIELGGKNESTEKAYLKLREICGKNTTFADIRQPLNELMALPIKNIVPPPIMISDGKIASVSPAMSLADEIKSLIEKVDKAQSLVSMTARNGNSATQTDMRQITEKLDDIGRAVAAAKPSDEVLTKNSDWYENLLGEIKSLREEVTTLGSKLDKTEEESDEVSEEAKQNQENVAPAAEEETAAEEKANESDVIDLADEKLENILAELDKIKDDTAVLSRFESVFNDKIAQLSEKLEALSACPAAGNDIADDAAQTDAVENNDVAENGDAGDNAAQDNNAAEDNADDTVAVATAEDANEGATDGAAEVSETATEENPSEENCAEPIENDVKIAESGREATQSVEELKSDIDKINSDIMDLKSSIDCIELNVDGIGADVEALKTDIAEIKKGMGSLDEIKTMIAALGANNKSAAQLSAESYKSVKDEIKNDIKEDIKTLREQMFAVDMAAVKDKYGETIYESYNNLLMEEVRKITSSIAELNHANKNDKTSDHLKVLRKDVDSIKAKNLKLSYLPKQVEGIKNKVDSIYKAANKTSKEPEILSQLKDLRAALTKLDNALQKQFANAAKKSQKPIGNNEVSRSIAALKKELSSLAEVVKDMDAPSPEDVIKAPEEAAASPEKEVKAPEEVTALPEEENKAPEEATAVPEEEVKAPEEEAALPEEETKAPEEAAALPEEEDNASGEATALPEEETKAQEEATALPEEEDDASGEAAAVPDEITKALEEAAALFEEEIKAPEEEVKTPEEATNKNE